MRTSFVVATLVVAILGCSRDFGLERTIKQRCKPAPLGCPVVFDELVPSRWDRMVVVRYQTDGQTVSEALGCGACLSELVDKSIFFMDGERIARRERLSSELEHLVEDELVFGTLDLTDTSPTIAYDRERAHFVATRETRDSVHVWRLTNAGR